MRGMGRLIFLARGTMSGAVNAKALWEGLALAGVGVLSIVAIFSKSRISDRDQDLIRQTVKDAFDVSSQKGLERMSTQVSLDIEAMTSMYDEYGELGLYAYLRVMEIAKDWHHGQFIIKHIFLPEYNRRNHGADEGAA